MKNYFAILICICIPFSLQAQLIISGHSTISDTIGQYRKFEVGMSLNVTPGVWPLNNKYNYNNIRTWAVFTGPNGEKDTIDGFWYQPFTRCDTCYDPTHYLNPWTSDTTHKWPKCEGYNILAVDSENGPGAYLNRVSTSFPRRIRFATGITGNWSYDLHATMQWTDSLWLGTWVHFNVVADTIDAGHSFTVVSSSDKGYIKVAPNGRNFCYADSTVFIPIGINTEIPNTPDTQYTRVPYIINVKAIPHIAQYGGNLVRVLMQPRSFGLEWIEDGLGVYERRQDRAFDLDSVIACAEQYGAYVLLEIGSDEELMNIGGSWLQNPYRTANGGYIDHVDQLWTDTNAINTYKNKLRYIMARWGYSAHLFAVEHYSELDEYSLKDTDVNNSHWNFWWKEANIYNWYRSMVQCDKKYNKHVLHTISFAGGYEVGRADTPTCMYNIPELDFFSVHDYQARYNINHYRNGTAAKNRYLYPSKPLIFSEFYTQFNSVNVNWDSWSANLVHAGFDWSISMWAQALGGMAGPGIIWGESPFVYLDKSMSCYCGQDENFKALSLFLQNEPIFNQSYVVISNPCMGTGHTDSLYNNISDTGNFDNPSNTNRCHCHFKYDSSLYNSYKTGGISTTNDSLIEVFGLKVPDRVIGYVRNKGNYWWNMKDGLPSLPNSLVSTYPGLVPTRSNDSVSISGLAPGKYKLEFYSTYGSYPLRSAGNDTDGGVIDTFTVNPLLVGCDGVLKFKIPVLKPMADSDATAPYAADYGFKARWIGLEASDTIRTNTTWNMNGTIFHPVITIKSGATLTIENNTINMPANGIIRVMPGAHLIVDNAVLTRNDSMCGTFWGGIEAVGNNSLSQYVPGNQALVTIRNGSLITNAINGVSNWDSTNTHSGGMIQASNSYFVNNMLALDFEPFENQSQSNSNIYPDMSYLSNCTFRVDSNYKGGISNHPFIGMATVHGVYGLRYWGCQFLNENQDTFKGKGYGIYCMDGSIWLEPSCPGNVVLLNSSSCSNPIRNRFKCLSRGIYVDASMSLDAASIIDQAVFDSCSIGVHVKTMNTVSVTRSSFLVGRGAPIVAFSDVGACNQNIGIYMQNSSQFRIEADTFNGINDHSWGTLGYLSDWKNMGVAVDNSGKNDNTVYMNTFNGIDYACYTRGPNSGGLLPPSPGSYAGLRFACNTFSNDTTDIHISSFAPNNFNFTSINISQGSLYAAANNIFLSGGRIYNGGVPIEYYYDSMNVSQSLPTATNGHVLFYKSGAASCQSSFDVNNTTTAKRAGSTQLSTMKNAYYLNNDSLISDLSTYIALMDAGNADSLQYVISHTSDPAALNRIMGSVSPYLSSTSLEVLSHTTVLSHFTYFNILESNPESLRGGGVIDSLKGSDENPLSDIEANELDSVALTSTGRSLLEGHMSDVGRTRWGLAQDILRALKEDHKITGTCYIVTDTNSIWYGLDSNSQYVYFDSIGVWLQNINTLWSQYAQVGYYSFLDPHDTSSLADTALLHASYFFGLSDSASKDENVDYYVLWSILKEVRADNRNTDQLTDSEKTILKGIADSVGANRGGQIAYSLAHNATPYVRGVPPFNCFYYEGEEGKHNNAGGHKSNAQNQGSNPLLPVSNLRADCSLSVYPNPASSNVYFAYNISGNPENIALLINDAVGEEIKHFSLADKEGVVNLDIQGLKPGVYIYMMRDDKGVIGMGKIVVMN